MELIRDKNYYFDYFNHHLEYNTLMYTEDSDVIVSALQYDVHKHENFKNMIDNESNYDE